MMHLPLVAVAFLSGTANAASRSELVREACATEISMFCAGQKDVATCLTRRNDDVTDRCRSALIEQPQLSASTYASNSKPDVSFPPAAAKVWEDDDASDLTFASSRPALIGGAGLGNIWIDQEAKGTAKLGFPRYREIVADEVKISLPMISDRLRQPSYRKGFPRPMRIRATFDPTGENMEGFSMEVLSGNGPNQQVGLNMAMWDDCPSRPMVASVVRHELTHAVIHDVMRGQEGKPIPQWFDEGVAMYLGGDPERTIALDTSFRVYGKTYSEKLSCRLDNFGGASNATILDCYPYYLLAVRYLDETFPGVLAQILADLKVGQPIHASIEKHTGQDWTKFVMTVDEYVNMTYAKMSIFRTITGRRWWWYMKWCQS